jgi:PAS domain S-box-containing protein
VQVFEASHRRADGSLYPVEVHLQLFRQDGQGVYLAVIQDITERKQSEASLQASEQRFRFWVDATESVFWMADRSGALVEPSPSLERLTGLSRECCLGHGRLAALHPEDRDNYAAELRRAVGLGEAFELQLRYWDAGAGAYRWYLERGVPHRTEDGSIQGWLGAGVSIDRQKRAEASQQDMMRRKDEFIAMLGHELRNPLAPLQNANDVLGAMAGSDPTLQWVHAMVGRHAAHLIRLVDDLLDVGRLLRGKIALQPESIAVVTLLRQLAESHTPEIAARGQQLHLSLPEEAVVIPGDPVRLTQIFDNLLNNAIRYTPDGGHIWLEAAAEGDECVIRVRDSGIGIPGDLLPHIFDPFAQGQRDLDRSEGGLGIGLTVARQLVVLHHGDLEARSAGVDQGSEFVVRLPQGDGPAGRGDAESPGLEPAVANPPLRPIRVLIVDDNVDAAQSLTLLLEYFGIVVETAADGPQGLELARDASPDLILLDIGLPGMDGFEVARRLRQMDATRAARIIAVTGYAQREYRVRARKVGFDGYLVKPIRLDQIRDLVDSFSEGPGLASPSEPGFVAPQSRAG